MKNACFIFILCFAVIAFAEKFTIVLIPDTQYPIQGDTSLVYNQFAWIASHKDSLNIKYVLQEGDFTNGGNLTQYAHASTAINFIEKVKLPYLITPGNHDFDCCNGSNLSALKNYNKTFPINRIQTALEVVSSYVKWGGSYPAGTNSNSYHLFTVGGIDWAILELQFGAGFDNGIMSWANSVLKQYPLRKFIILTHSYLSDATSYTPEGTPIWNNLVNVFGNIMFVFCGHVVGGECTWVRTNRAGTQVYQMLIDHQNSIPGSTDNTRTRFLQFDTKNKTVFAWEYSPPDKKMFIGSSAQFTWTNVNFDSVDNPEIPQHQHVTGPRSELWYEIKGRTLTFYLEQPGCSSLRIFNARGKMVADFSNDCKTMTSGRHRICLNPSTFITGIYVADFDNGKKQAAKTLAIAK